MSLKDRIIGDKPISLGGGGVDARALKVQPDSEFDAAFEDALKPGKIWHVRDPNDPRFIGVREPHPKVVDLAERILVHMYDKQDSILCEPDELAEKAFQLAEAFQRAYSKRVK